MKILVINPGATSTKICVFEDEKEIMRVGIDHDAAEIAKYPNVVSQAPFRKEAILNAVRENGYKLEDFDAVCGRGGLFKHIPSGTYKVNDAVIKDIENPPYGEHAANLGAYLAKELGDSVGIPAFFVDPVCVDEFEPLARFSGLDLPGFERQSFFHALNHKSVARKAADMIGKPYEELNLVVCARCKEHSLVVLYCECKFAFIACAYRFARSWIGAYECRRIDLRNVVLGIGIHTGSKPEGCCEYEWC